MSDSWAMDLAREVQVYSTPDGCFSQDSPAEWHSPTSPIESSSISSSSPEEHIWSSSSLAPYAPLSENDFVVKEVTLPRGTTDDGYASCCSSTSSLLDEESDRMDSTYGCSIESTSYRKSVESKRLKKNKKQREREWKKKVYINVLKKVIISSPLLDVKPKGSRRFTECDTLRSVKELIEKLKQGNSNE